MNLDTEQALPIEYKGSSIIMAGPGSGKTRVLVSKAQQLSKDKENHICLTFTRNAAAEIRKRSPLTKACTIHSLCYNAYHRGEFDSYDELLYHVIDSKKVKQYDWVLVDEFQDLNEIELNVVFRIARDKVFFVGDPNQSIFGYQDALGRQVIKALNNSCYKPKQFALKSNYRSSDYIVRKLENIYPLNLIAKGPKKLKGTVITFRTNRQLDAWRLKLHELGYSFNVRKKGDKFPGEVENLVKRDYKLLLSTMHCLKGSEFKNVIALDWGERLAEPNLFYVTVSRASERFYLTNSLREVTDLLGELKCHPTLNKSTSCS